MTLGLSPRFAGWLVYRLSAGLLGLLVCYVGTFLLSAVLGRELGLTVGYPVLLAATAVVDWTIYSRITSGPSVRDVRGAGAAPRTERNAAGVRVTPPPYAGLTGLPSGGDYTNDPEAAQAEDSSSIEV